MQILPYIMGMSGQPHTIVKYNRNKTNVSTLRMFNTLIAPVCSTFMFSAFLISEENIESLFLIQES